MVDRTKIGARVDEKTYVEFKKMVDEVHGQTRGVLGDEISNALREYMKGYFEGSSESNGKGDVSNEELLREIQSLKTERGSEPPRSPSDPEGGAHTHSTAGGTVSSDEAGSSRSNGSKAEPSSADKPSDRASQAAKTSWMVDVCDIEGNVEFEEIKKFVRSHYQYRSDTVEDLAWGVAGALAPDESMLDDGVLCPADENIHSSGAWMIELEQDPDDESGSNEGLCVLCGELGAKSWSMVVKSNWDGGSGSGESTDSDGEESTDSDSDGEESMKESLDDVDISGSDDDVSIDDLEDAQRDAAEQRDWS